MKKAIAEMILLITLLLFTVMIISCKKEEAAPAAQPIVNNPPPPPPSIGPYSGKWIGTIIVDDINPTLCYYAGSPITVQQDWLVSPDSSVTIVDKLIDYNTTIPWPQTWKGWLINQDSISITLNRDINCDGAATPMFTELRTRIVRTGNKYTIKAKVDYPMCPPNCLFTFNYSIEKQE